MSNRAIEEAWHAMLRQLSSPSWIDVFFAMVDTTSRIVGPDLDDLEYEQSEHENPLRIKLLGALKKIKPLQKLAVLAVVRNEAVDLIEWFAHYRTIGVDHFFIYTNNNDDATEHVLNWLSKTGRVTPIFTTASKGVNVQFKNYEHALTLLPELRLFEWVLVVDADEFLVPAAKFDYNLPTLLASTKEDVDAIIFPWKWRLWDRHFERTPGLLWERYEHAVASDHFKSLIKLKNVLSLRELHWPKLTSGGIICDSAFVEIPTASPFVRYQNKTDEGGWIDHYWGKSFEEFLRKKSRGDTLEVKGGHWRRQFEDYFLWTSKPRAETYSPLPQILAARIREELGALQTKRGYNQTKSEVEKFDALYVSKVRSDPKVRKLFDEFISLYPLR